jgi:FMN-dependent NADH-azoreductase
MRHTPSVPGGHGRAAAAAGAAPAAGTMVATVAVRARTSVSFRRLFTEDHRKAWLDNVILFGRTAGEAPSAKGTPVTVVASRGGAYGPGTPREGYEYVQNYLTAVLADALGLDVDFIVPELTMAPQNPAMAELVPLYEASRDRALEEAATKAKQLAERFAA